MSLCFLFFFWNWDRNCTFCGGTCRWEDTRWHLAVNLPPKPRQLWEEENSVGLLRRVKRNCFYTQVGPSPGCGVGTGRTRLCSSVSCLWESPSWRREEACGQDDPCRSFPTDLIWIYLFSSSITQSYSLPVAAKHRHTEALSGPRSRMIPSPHQTWRAWNANRKGAKGWSGELCCWGVCCDAQGSVQSRRSYNRSLSHTALTAVELTTEGPYSPKLSLKGPWKASVLTVRELMRHVLH